jgi:hypothetical protein
MTQVTDASDSKIPIVRYPIFRMNPKLPNTVLILSDYR